MTRKKMITVTPLLLAMRLLAGGPPSDADAPYLATFHAGEKQVVYVAAQHHSPQQYPVAMDDPTFKTISAVFSKEHPDAVIVEGVDPANKIASFINFARECAAAGYNVPGKGCGEPALTAALADVSGAQVYSGEPPSKSSLSDWKKLATRSKII